MCLWKNRRSITVYEVSKYPSVLRREKKFKLCLQTILNSLAGKLMGQPENIASKLIQP